MTYSQINPTKVGGISDLWHCTRLGYLDLILKNGIKAKIPQQRGYKPKGIYLSEYQFNWMWNTQRQGKFKGAILRINIKGLELVKDYHIDKEDTKYNSKRIGKDFICLSNIEPERIKEVLIETEPNIFQPINLQEVKPNSSQ